MPVKQRVAIPKQVEHEVLFRNQNACCVCRKTGVQIHHIDGNPSNNRLSNLCVLCIEHHALASSRSSMTKGLEPRLLRKYKQEWEGFLVRQRKTGVARSVRDDTAADRARVRFEIKRIIYSLPERRLARGSTTQLTTCIIGASSNRWMRRTLLMRWAASTGSWSPPKSKS